MAAKILVTTDFSDESVRAFPHARKQLELEGGEILLVSVLEDYFVPSVMYPEIAPLMEMEEFRGKAEKASRDRLEKIRQEHFSGLPAQSHVIVSTRGPASAIAAFSTEQQCTLIVIASNGRGTFGTLFIGSTVQRLLIDAKCPLLVIPRPK